MLDIDLAIQATVVILPALPGLKTVVTARRGIALREAIRFVMEHLPARERPRALIQTPLRSIYIAEIEAIYEQPDFPRDRAA